MESLLSGVAGGIAGSVGGGGQGNIQQLVQSLSLTGNIYLDTFILMNIYTFCKTYFEFAVDFLKRFVVSTFQFVSYYVKSILKSKLTGKIVLRVNIDIQKELYSIIKQEVFQSNVESDINEDWKFKWLRVENELNESNYFDRWKETYEHYEQPVSMDVDYNSKEKVSYTSSHYLKETVSKIFTFVVPKNTLQGLLDSNSKDFFQSDRTFYIRFIWKYNNNNNGSDSNSKTPNYDNQMFIDLIIFDLPKNHLSKQTYFNVVKSFLDSRFKLYDNIIYKYHLKHNHNDNFRQTYMFNDAIYRDRNDNFMWLQYGDNNYDEVTRIITQFDNTKSINGATSTGNNSTNIVCFKDDYLNPTTMLTLATIPTTTTNDLETLVSIKTGTSSQTGNYYSILLKILGVKDDASCSNRGFFCFGTLVVVLNYGGMWVLQMGKKVTKSDINKILENIIETRVQKLNGAAQQKLIKSKKQTTVAVRKQKQWEQTLLGKRSFQTVYLPDDLKKSIIREFDNFIQMQKLYVEYEIPYRKGVLFYGPPGTGKTSIVKAIAYEYQIPLFILDVNDEEINDESIVSILNGLGNSHMKIILFEDIDTAFAEKEKMVHEIKTQQNDSDSDDDDQWTAFRNRARRYRGGGRHHLQKVIPIEVSPNAPEPQLVSNAPPVEGVVTTDNSGDTMTVKTTTGGGNGSGGNGKKGNNGSTTTKFLTYSGLLNALDGVTSNQNGVITIMTTNYIERLGTAFLRPGRIDCKFELKECTKEQIIRMTTNFVQKRIVLEKELFKDCLGNQPKYENLSSTYFKEKIENFAEKLCKGNIYSKIRPCDLQVYLLKYINDIENVFENVDTLLSIE